MTDKLSDEEKKARKAARKQQKAKSTTAVTVNQPKPEDTNPPATPPVNLCDDCAYEYGECQGIPKFSEEEGADDRVIECSAFVNVSSMPTADPEKKGPVVEEPPAQPPQEPEGETEEEPAEGQAEIDPDLEARRKKTQRFFQEQDFGTCQSCDQPLKRTALNRDVDAVRCVNGRCRQYRFIIRNISAGV